MSSAEKESQKTQRIDSAHVLRFLRSVQRINILSIPQLWARRLRPFYSENQIVQAVSVEAQEWTNHNSRPHTKCFV